MLISIKTSKTKLIFVSIGLFFLLGAVIIGLAHYNKELNENKTIDSEPINQVIYGEYLEWSEVKVLFPKNAEANVIDFITGASFRVQRRGGTSHADVQPLTAQDTAIMKNIYNGNWSWKRRAIFVQLDNGQRIAASMHGMPHGNGAIKNNFPGHFCIHFKGSKTHGSSSENLAHQMMIWKSAGIVQEKIQVLKTQEIIDTFITALDQNDQYIVELLLLLSADSKAGFINDLAQIENAKIDKLTTITENEQYNVELRVKYQGITREIKKKIDIIIIKTPQGYKINDKSWRAIMHEKM